MSLVISLTCALLATLLQQWARRYLKITQSRYSPHKRARIRAFFSEGVTKCLLPWAVDALPTLLHLSLFLFFAGLVVFLGNVDLTIFKLVLSWVGLCAGLYGCITCMPIFHHDSPYYTPLSLPTWHVVTGITFLFYRFLRWFNDLFCCWDAYDRYLDLEKSYRKSLVQGMQKTAEETALKTSSDIDARAFMWTLDCLDEDHELERFFSSLPGFRRSTVVKDPVPSLTEEDIWKLYGALNGLLDRTFSSDFLPVSVKDRRAMICAKAIDRERTPNASILYATLFKYQHSGPVVSAITNILKECGNNFDRDKVLHALVSISEIFATRQFYDHDSSWYILASYELGFHEASLREYATQGDSLSLVILIHFVRKQYSHFRKLPLYQQDNFSRILAEASKFDAKDTSSELQHEFCALWNQLVNEAQGSNDPWMAYFFLRPVRYVFLSLHQDTDSAPARFSASTDDWDLSLDEPSSYPLCKVPHHLSDSTSHTHDDGVSATPARAIPHDPNDTAFIPSITSPDPPPSSTHAPLPVFTDALPHDNQIFVPVSTQVIGQTATEGCRVPTISLSPVIEPSRTTQSSASSPSPRSNESASPPADIAVGHSTLSRAPSDYLNVRSSPSPTPILDAILPTGLLSFQGATRSDPSILATTAEGEGSTKADLNMEEAREEITATADIPPQMSTLSRVTAVAINDPSKGSPSTEHIEQRPPDTIVAERSAVGHTRSSDVQILSSPTLGLPIGMLLPLNSAVALSEAAYFSLDSHSQMLAPAASGSSHSWDPSAAGEREECAKAGLRRGKGKDEPHDDNMLPSDVPMRLLPLQPTINVANAGLSQSSLDAEHTSEHSLRPRGEYDIV